MAVVPRATRFQVRLALSGQGRLAVTTRALDEAGRRIGGYLLGHSAVNVGFGAATSLGLFLLAVPYPILWGMLAAAFRFVPSVGVWLVAPLPAALAFIGGTGFLPPALVLGLFLVLELLTANVAEPRVCGKSVGLAPVPLFLAVAFWTGLWGVGGVVGDHPQPAHAAGANGTAREHGQDAQDLPAVDQRLPGEAADAFVSQTLRAFGNRFLPTPSFSHPANQ